MAENNNNLGTPNSGKGNTGRQSLTSANANKAGQSAGRTPAGNENLKKGSSSTGSKSLRQDEDMDDEETGTNRSRRSSDPGKSGNKR